MSIDESRECPSLPDSISLQPPNPSHVDVVVTDTLHLHEPEGVGGAPSVVHATVPPSPAAGVSVDQVDHSDQTQAEVPQLQPPGYLSGQDTGAVSKVESENIESIISYPRGLDCGL